jgi:hypothetical protein
MASSSKELQSQLTHPCLSWLTRLTFTPTVLTCGVLSSRSRSTLLKASSTSYPPSNLTSKTTVSETSSTKSLTISSLLLSRFPVLTTKTLLAVITSLKLEINSSFSTLWKTSAATSTKSGMLDLNSWTSTANGNSCGKRLLMNLSTPSLRQEPTSMINIRLNKNSYTRMRSPRSSTRKSDTP